MSTPLLPPAHMIQKVTIDGEPIRIFSREALNARVDSALAGLKPGQHVASVLHADLEGLTWETVLGRPSGGRWTIFSSVRKPWHDGKLEAEVAIRFAI